MYLQCIVSCVMKHNRFDALYRILVNITVCSRNISRVQSFNIIVYRHNLIDWLDSAAHLGWVDEIRRMASKGYAPRLLVFLSFATPV